MYNKNVICIHGKGDIRKTYFLGGDSFQALNLSESNDILKTKFNKIGDL